MIPLFISVAVVLVLFGGLLAAADSALSVLSRTDLVDLASHSRSKSSLLAIAADVGTHVNAINFMRVVSETTAAVVSETTHEVDRVDVRTGIVGDREERPARATRRRDVDEVGAAEHR